MPILVLIILLGLIVVEFRTISGVFAFSNDSGKCNFTFVSFRIVLAPQKIKDILNIEYLLYSNF